MRFCQAFMTELSRYIGDNVDIPAGDLGVGAREIGFMYGQYKKLMNGFDERVRIAEYANKFKADYFPGKKPLNVPCHLAFPFAMQNEIDDKDALEMVQNGCQAVSEGANMPTSLEGLKVFQAKNILFGPGKAANAGGVAVSGMEMTQNRIHFAWDRDQLDTRLGEIIKNIHKQRLIFGTHPGGI